MYRSHVFICTNQRSDGKASCGASGSIQLRDDLKKLCKQKSYAKDVRINAAGCLGLCEKGIVAVIYPQQQWFENMTPADLPLLEQALDQALDHKA